MNPQASSMCTSSGEPLVLSGVDVSAVLRDLLAEVTVSQVYRNDERTNIEAVYTFPLPLDAVLLDLEVQLGNRRLKGQVMAKASAERGYDDAVVDGDAAVMLEALEPGLYTMNVGNLLPGESAHVTFRYAVLHRWSGDRLRMFLPTTVAPRYGRSPHHPRQAPETSLMVENAFTLRVEACGVLKDARFECPSHELQQVREHDRVVLSLQRRAAPMDRDFVLDIRAPEGDRSFALCGRDIEGTACLASFQPMFSGLRRARRVDLAIVIDCSGSMAGDSIAQAGKALSTILDGLSSADRVEIVPFGSTASPLFGRLSGCTQDNLGKARKFAAGLAADMGGTEIGGALRAARDALADVRQGDILLVTDGEVGDWQPVVEEAARTGHRVFTVSVGHAVAEAFVRTLARTTGGACELVSPREGMAERIVRQFERMRAPRATSVSVRWPRGFRDTSPGPDGVLFEGDTLVAWGRMGDVAPGARVVLEVQWVDGHVQRQELELSAEVEARPGDGPSTIARLAAAARLGDMAAAEAASAAVQYQLVTEHTNWLVVAERAEGEKAKTLPELRKVKQTMAAGWGGTGAAEVAEMRSTASRTTLRPAESMDFTDCFSLVLPDPMPRSQRTRAGSPPSSAPADPIEPMSASIDPPRFHPLVLLEAISAGLVRNGPLTTSTAMQQLRALGLVHRFEAVFEEAARIGLRDEDVAAVVVYRILERLARDLNMDDIRAEVAPFLREVESIILADLVELGKSACDGDGGTLFPRTVRYVRGSGAADLRERLARIPVLLERVDAACRQVMWEERSAATA